MREEFVNVITSLPFLFVNAITSLPFFGDLKHGKEDKSRGMKRKGIQTRSKLGILAETNYEKRNFYPRKGGLVLTLPNLVWKTDKIFWLYLTIH